MLKRDYFLQALSAGAFRYKAWVLHAFSHTRLTEADQFAYRLYKGKDHYFFLDPNETGDFPEVTLEDSDSQYPPFHFRESIELKAGEVPNLDHDITSDYGKLLANWVALVYPLGDKIPYVEGEFKLNDISQQIEKRLTTDPEYQTPKSFISPNPIYVKEFIRYMDALLSLEGYSQLCVPAASPKSLITDPQVAIRRAELVKEYAGQLNDPVVVAKIEAELVAMDKAWIKGDISEGFYRKDKMFESSRKKVHIMQGYSTGFGLEPSTSIKPLSEGWTAEELPGGINSLREGAYGRGKLTALGGAATKTVNRMFQNVSLIEGDCGTQLGWSRTLNSTDVKEFYGYYYFKKDGSTAFLTEDTAKDVIDKPTLFRSPQFCKAKGVNFCRFCVGEINAENENAIGASVASMTSQLVGISLSAAHAVTLKATKYTHEQAID